MEDISNINEYFNFFNEVKERIRKSQYKALKKVNVELIHLYLDIGKMIVSKQTEQSWGSAVIEKLSADLQNEYPGMQGFSVSNLWSMRMFCIEIEQNTILQPLVREISWTKNIVILNKCKEIQEREFYYLHTKKFGLTKDVLINQIENKTSFRINRLYSIPQRDINLINTTGDYVFFRGGKDNKFTMVNK